MKKVIEVVGWAVALLATLGICREAFFSAAPSFSLIAGMAALLVLGATTASALHLSSKNPAVKGSSEGSIELLKSPILWLGVPMVLVMVWGFLR